MSNDFNDRLNTEQLIRLSESMERAARAVELIEELLSDLLPKMLSDIKGS